MKSALEGPQTTTNTLQRNKPWWYWDDDDDDEDDDDDDDYDDDDASKKLADDVCSWYDADMFCVAEKYDRHKSTDGTQFRWVCEESRINMQTDMEVN